MKDFFKMPLFFMIMAVFMPLSFANAEFKCFSHLSYMLDKDSHTTEVFFAEIRAQAEDEAQARNRLESEVAKGRARAMQQCRKFHENMSGCLQTKLESASNTLQAASFSARKALEESFVSDCRMQQAVCKEIKSSEIKCEEFTKTDSAAETDSKAKDVKGGADKKAKK